MATILTIAVNNSATDLAYGTSGVDWTVIDTGLDYLVFSAGSATVADGQPLPSSSDLNQAGTIIIGSDVDVAVYLLADNSANILKEIDLAGNQNKRYVFAFSFDGATGSEPVLEVWDDSDMDSIDNYSLGTGVASSSWIRGITTTDGLPGDSWTGSRLAGSASGNFLWLNNENGALSGADVLYCQLRIVVPASFPYSSAETPVWVCKYTTA